MKLIIIVVSILMLLNLLNVNAQQNEKIQVIASFYPFYEIAKEIGGNNTAITSVIPFSVEPHDYEATPQKILTITKADMIIYNGIGFDAWLGQKQQFRNSLLVDVSKGLPLIDSKQQQQQQESKDSEQNMENKHDEHKFLYDPHIWLDPIIVKNISKTISNALIKLDPTNTDSYKQNTNNFIQKLDALDSLIKKSLSNCELKDFISFHQAFQYFANRYGLTQHTVHESLSPEGEILPQQITKLIKLAKDLNINTIYSEELADPRLSQTLASEIPNGKVLLLSPIEGVNQEEQKKNIGYIDKMQMNLENLREGLKCK